MKPAQPSRQSVASMMHDVADATEEDSRNDISTLTTPLTSAATPSVPSVRQSGMSLLELLAQWVRSNFHRPSESLKEALEEVLEEHEDENGHTASDMRSEEREMLENILAFGELEVEDVLIPRPDIVAVPYTASLQDVVLTIQQHGHTRMPVYRQDLDDILGIVHSKDLIRFIHHEDSFQLAEIIRPITVVPPSMKVVDLLVRMRSSGVHMALVVDEFGGTEGIVTLENLFEQIVGDIHDEYDEDIRIPALQELAPGIWLAGARTEVEELEEATGVTLYESDEADYHTLGGLIFHLLGEVPRRGTEVEHHGLRFEVLEADARSIHRLRVTRPLQTQPVETTAP